MADANCTRKCVHCGDMIEPRINKTTGEPSKALRRYCGKTCRSQAGERRRGKRTSWAKKTVPAACWNCGEVFQSRPSTGSPDGWTRCCSDKCGKAHRSKVAALARADRMAILDKVRREVAALRRICRYVEQPAKTIRPCRECGSLTIGVKGYSRRCDECKAEAKRNYNRTPNGRALRKMHKAIRRARESVNAEPIDPIAVFERDKWKCQLCGTNTPRRLRGKMEPCAPELDHIIPLALGGGHLWGNVQCACRACNGRKGATAQGQLRIQFAV